MKSKRTLGVSGLEIIGVPGYIKEAAYQFSDLPGKYSISYVYPGHRHGVKEEVGGSLEEPWCFLT